jgi:hypothetical protein
MADLGVVVVVVVVEAVVEMKFEEEMDAGLVVGSTTADPSRSSQERAARGTRGGFRG